MRKVKVYCVDVRDSYGPRALCDLLDVTRSQVKVYLVGTTKAEALAHADAAGLTVHAAGVRVQSPDHGVEYLALRDAGLLTVDGEIVALHPQHPKQIARRLTGAEFAIVGTYERRPDRLGPNGLSTVTVTRTDT